MKNPGAGACQMRTKKRLLRQHMQTMTKVELLDFWMFWINENDLDNNAHKKYSGKYMRRKYPKILQLAVLK